MIELSDGDILARLTNTEDSTVERKTASDYRDCLKTAVGFSNSLPVDDPGIIFVGVGNDGTPQGSLDLDSLQKKVSDELTKIYPRIFPQMKVMRKDSKEFLAVIVRGSGNRPHFAGPSYIRDGSRTLEASDEQFARLIAERGSKTREILKWLGKEITLVFPEVQTTRRDGVKESEKLYRSACAVVTQCNQFYVTFEVRDSEWEFERVNSLPLGGITLAFDNRMGRLKLVHDD